MRRDVYAMTHEEVAEALAAKGYRLTKDQVQWYERSAIMKIRKELYRTLFQERRDKPCYSRT